MSNSSISHLSIKHRVLSVVGDAVIVIGLLTFSLLMIAGIYAETAYGLGIEPLACQSDKLLMKGNIFRDVSEWTKT